MTDSAELKKLVKQLQSATTDEEIKNILLILQADFQVNEALLRESKAGLAVGKLRSHSKKDVSDLAKEIVKKWKSEVERAKSKVSQNGKQPSRKSSLANTPVTPTTATGLVTRTDCRSAKGDGLILDFIGDKTRDKCLELIYDGLACDSDAPTDVILTLARGIESTVLAEFDGTTPAYKSKIRSFFVNLKDKSNPLLRQSIVSGDLPIDKFCKMTSQDMASEERKAQDNKIVAENLHKSLGAEEQQAETDAFQCSRCKQRKCRYRQAQTRSADEPMTTFVTCVNCNNRWKFS